MDIVCSKCEQIVDQFLARHTPEELRFVRILASNKTVFQGADNKAGVTDFLMAVGDCQRHYVKYHTKRGNDELIQMGIADKVSAEEFIVFIPGHHLAAEDLEGALAELQARAVKWKGLKLQA